MDNKSKELLEAKYKEAFSYYQQREKEFFNAWSSGSANSADLWKEMEEAWKKVDEIIQKLIK